ncbi:hypothetical protein ABBQ32_010612 [Trebouxia sp. C0010 RCD-2024]
MGGNKAGDEGDGARVVETAEEEEPGLEEAALGDADVPSTDPKEAPGGKRIPGGEDDSGEEEADGGEAEGAGGAGRVPGGDGEVPPEAAGDAATDGEEED